MSEEKKIKTETEKELTDKQLDAVAGGDIGDYFTCKKCGHTKAGRGISAPGGPFCGECFSLLGDNGAQRPQP